MWEGAWRFSKEESTGFPRVDSHTNAVTGTWFAKKAEIKKKRLQVFFSTYVRFFQTWEVQLSPSLWALQALARAVSRSGTGTAWTSPVHPVPSRSKRAADTLLGTYKLRDLAEEGELLHREAKKKAEQVSVVKGHLAMSGCLAVSWKFLYWTFCSGLKSEWVRLTGTKGGKARKSGRTVRAMDLQI